jgi:hypothetical protein
MEWWSGGVVDRVDGGGGSGRRSEFVNNGRSLTTRECLGCGEIWSSAEGFPRFSLTRIVLA